MEKIVLFDMDGTLIRNTDSVLLLCDIQGMDRQILQTLEENYRAKELTWIEGDHILAQKLKGLRTDVLAQEFERRVQIIIGLPEFLHTLKERGFLTVLLSAGVKQIVEIMVEKYDFDYGIGSTYEVQDGMFTGKILNHIGDEGKVEQARALCTQLGVNFNACIAIGDGESDLALFRQLHRTIALNAVPSLQEIASVSINTENIADLISIVEKLQMQCSTEVETSSLK